MSLPTHMDLPPWDMGAVLRPGRFLSPSSFLPFLLLPPPPPVCFALPNLFTGSNRRTHLSPLGGRWSQGQLLRNLSGQCQGEVLSRLENSLGLWHSLLICRRAFQDFK